MLHQYCIHVNILICPNSYVILVYRSKLTSDNQLRSPYFLVHTQLPFGIRHTCPLFCGIKLRSLRNINKTKHPKQTREMHCLIVWYHHIHICMYCECSRLHTSFLQMRHTITGTRHNHVYQKHVVVCCSHLNIYSMLFC